MHRVAVLVLGGVAAAACGTSTPAHDASVPIPMRIIVSDSSVAVYMDGKDMGGCGCNALVFPAVGRCSGSTDGNPCDGNPYCTSCISDFGIEAAGQRLTPTVGGSDPRSAFFAAPLPQGSLSLVVAGCGHPTARIPLDGTAFPTTTVQADYVAGSAHVSWTASPPTAEALLTLSGGVGGELCHVENVSDYTFANWPTALSVAVQPMNAGVDIDTDFGPVTVWRVGGASQQFPSNP